MNSITYTATLYHNDQTLSNQSDSDLNRLTVYLLNRLQEISFGATGIIVDHQGRVIRRCRKTTTQ